MVFISSMKIRLLDQLSLLPLQSTCEMRTVIQTPTSDDRSLLSILFCLRCSAYKRLQLSTRSDTLAISGIEVRQIFTLRGFVSIYYSQLVGQRNTRDTDRSTYHFWMGPCRANIHVTLSSHVSMISKSSVFVPSRYLTFY